MTLKIKNLNTDEEDMEVEFNSEGEITACFCYVPMLDAWINLTDKVFRRATLLQYIYEEYNKQEDAMLRDMAERQGYNK